jgi:predicted RNA binding protein YcfA (HicA-like mRNA interferase family)
MLKLPILTPKKIIKILEQIGFRLDHKTGSHFIFYNAENKRRVVVPFHAKDLPKGTFVSILKQAEITKEELKKYI